MRLTTHNARTGENGIFLAKHNDRDFDISQDSHIDPERQSENFYWTIYDETTRASGGKLSFEEAEQRFYQKNFSGTLEAQNQRYRADGHPERCKTITDIYKSPRTCPEETIFMIGKSGDTVSPAELLSIYQEYSAERKKKFPQAVVLDYALHADEEGAPHIHERLAWMGHNKDGLTPSQSRALAEMGVDRPDMSRPKNRYNNPKMAYTAACREIAISTCQSRDLQIQAIPKSPSKTGLSLLQYQTQQEKQQLQLARQRADAARQEADELLLDIRTYQRDAAREQEKLEELQIQSEDLKNRLQAVHLQLQRAQSDLRDSQKQYESMKNSLDKNAQRRQEAALRHQRQSITRAEQELKKISGYDEYEEER